MEKIPVVQVHTPAFVKDGKFHVRLIEGRFQNLRRLTTWPLITLFFGLVWVQFDGNPWLLFSFEQRRILLFGSALSWHDLPLLAGLMIAGACLLFFMAVAWGRVWCGFACPQSIWTWLFIRIEDVTEGRASIRARHDRKGLTPELVLRRVTKHLLWSLLSLITAITFTGYFIPVREIADSLITLQMSPALAGWLIIMSGLTYANAGLVREKICLHACPYSRFQGVMFDSDTRTVSYDINRGEPRAQKHDRHPQSGDCVDCGLCVQVCPAGIDIRNGLQAACIDCAACIDACDLVMERLDKPAGLIRFASETELSGEKPRFMRPRLMGYGFVLIFAVAAVLYGFTATTHLLVEVRRDRHALFIQLDETTFCNTYRVKVENFAEADMIQVSVTGNQNYELFGPSQIDLNESGAAWLPYRVCATDINHPRSELAFNFRGHGVETTKKTTFLAAAPPAGPQGN
ncbi:cytochrome c oxidase accessory protein CcoG [Marinobacterium sediminicola]|uniref:Cytochrome c oxidase accessory protein FixG n=1 Tax=Marinobacterium sediminicola TaxID=518898 RepID=A0ABY1RXE0_9GAMM|nr:cytochrome c oxidase accessory protein CcoG [Marinobacterium sediminicola]ULG67775.1 cytochrome c oxidase accessory protein CcoG [Marinobacterium sediminicola]SMR71572.1 cytochrome c oxidase accessory protein FixG [Marinobacterium sediminicola]